MDVQYGPVVDDWLASGHDVNEPDMVSGMFV